MELKEILKEAVIIDEHQTFRGALNIMLKKQTNSVLVTNEEGMLVGEVSVADLMDAIVPAYLDGDSIEENFATEEKFKEAVREAADREVGDFMTMESDPIEIGDELITVAGKAIAERRARIPVVDRQGHPIGVISRRGLKEMLASFLSIRV